MVTSCCRAVIISRFSFFRFTTPFSPLFNFFPCASIRSWILICIQQSQNQTDYSIKHYKKWKKKIYDKNWRIRFWKFYFQDHSKNQTPGSYIIWEMQTWNDDQTLISEKKFKIIIKKNRSKRFGFLTHNFGMCWWRSFWASCTTTTAAATAIAHHRLRII